MFILFYKKERNDDSAEAAPELDPSNREIKGDAALTEGPAVGADVRARTVLGTCHAFRLAVSAALTPAHCAPRPRDTGRWRWTARRRWRGERFGAERSGNANRAVPLRSLLPRGFSDFPEGSLGPPRSWRLSVASFLNLSAGRSLIR